MISDLKIRIDKERKGKKKIKVGTISIFDNDDKDLGQIEFIGVDHRIFFHVEKDIALTIFNYSNNSPNIFESKEGTQVIELNPPH